MSAIRHPVPGVGEVASADGTRIGFDVRGTGPSLVLVHGGLADRTAWSPLVDSLAASFTVFNIDRRGRGRSAKEVLPYALSREVEDLIAIARHAGGRACVVAHSFGCLCAIEAAVVGMACAGLLLYEPALAVDGQHVFPPGSLDDVGEPMAIGDHEGALRAFLTSALGLDPAKVAALEGTPAWCRELAMSHTLLREALAVEHYRIDLARLARVGVPVRVLLGTESPPVFAHSARALATALPRAELVEFEGEGHRAMSTAPDRIVAEIRSFALP